VAWCIGMLATYRNAALPAASLCFLLPCGYICPFQNVPTLLQHTQYKNLRLALVTSLALSLVVSLFLLVYGKTQSFLIINGAHHPALDVFFTYCTFLGDGLIYVPLLIYSLFFNRSFIVPVVLSILICTLLTHFLKRVVFPHDLRPISLEGHDFIIHKISGVYINRANSFPSGHTATAFSTALLLATVLRKKAWAALLPALPFLVGYSRVYLAQHFVTDVLAGMLVGIVTAVLVLWLQPIVINALPASWQKKLEKREPPQVPATAPEGARADGEYGVLKKF
jgi:membrane-associated phospholipid phosphatase